MKIKSASVRIKAGPQDELGEGEFLVYPSTFTRTPDSYGDVVAKGAFLADIEAWKASGATLPGLYGHRFDDPDYFVAAATDMGEDDHGWWVRGAFDLESPKGAQVYRLVKGRRLNQLSFAYDVLEDGAVELADGTRATELRKLKVYEFSFVPIGANQDTSVVAIKALADEMKSGRTVPATQEAALREARDSIDSVLASLADAGDEKTAHPGGNQTSDEASGTGEAKDEEPVGAKSEEPAPHPSARVLAELSLLTLD